MRRALSRGFTWKLLLVVSSIALLWAISVYLLGGVESRMFGVRVSSRDPYRAALVALLAGIAGLTILAQEAFGPGLNRIWTAIRPARRAFAPMLALLVLLIGLKFGARVAGGADSYGYISQAYLWLQGDLRIQQPFAAMVPWPNADWTFAPLGYRPGATPHTLVPIYSPGLPLIMAGFVWLFGSCGPYYVMPLASAALVLLTYVLGSRVGGASTGAIAALLMATSPAMLFQMMMPMTDVIVATLWTAAVVLAVTGKHWSIVASGIVCGVAILVRPNLVPLAAVPFLIIVWQSGSLARALTRGLFFGAAVAPGILLVAAINNYLYGSPTESGYGTVSSIYSVANLGANLVRYPAWLLESQGSLVFVFLIAVFRIRRAGSDELPWRVWFLLFIALVLLPYLFYIPFDDWWYLRFVLPAFPFIFILAADSLRWVTSRLPHSWGTIALLAGCALMSFTGVRFALERNIASLGADERRYAEVGHFIAQKLPAKSVCLAMQHSGSIRHYSTCMTLRYDILEPAWLDRAISHLVERGYHPYIVLEDWEEEPFRRRFKTHSPLGSLEWAPVAEMEGGYVKIYDAGAHERAMVGQPSTRIPEIAPDRCLGPVHPRRRRAAGA